MLWEENMVSSVTRLAAGLAAIAGVASFSAAEPALAQSSVKIGYALSSTGPNAGGASVTTLPNYEIWVKEVNAAGGLKLGDKRCRSRSCSTTTAPARKRQPRRWTG